LSLPEQASTPNARGPTRRIRERMRKAAKERAPAP
jgi:hypothetical protein